jgi:hypothetical protein
MIGLPVRGPCHHRDRGTGTLRPKRGRAKRQQSASGRPQNCAAAAWARPGGLACVHCHFQADLDRVTGAGESAGARRQARRLRAGCPGGGVAAAAGKFTRRGSQPSRAEYYPEGRWAGSLTYCCKLASAPRKRRPVQIAGWAVTLAGGPAAQVVVNFWILFGSYCLQILLSPKNLNSLIKAWPIFKSRCCHAATLPS